MYRSRRQRLLMANAKKKTWASGSSASRGSTKNWANKNCPLFQDLMNTRRITGTIHQVALIVDTSMSCEVCGCEDVLKSKGWSSCLSENDSVERFVRIANSAIKFLPTYVRKLRSKPRRNASFGKTSSASDVAGSTNDDVKEELTAFCAASALCCEMSLSWDGSRPRDIIPLLPSTVGDASSETKPGVSFKVLPSSSWEFIPASAACHHMREACVQGISTTKTSVLSIPTTSSSLSSCQSLPNGNNHEIADIEKRICSAIIRLHGSLQWDYGMTRRTAETDTDRNINGISCDEKIICVLLSEYASSILFPTLTDTAGVWNKSGKINARSQCSVGQKFGSFGSSTLPLIEKLSDKLLDEPGGGIRVFLVASTPRSSGGEMANARTKDLLDSIKRDKDLSRFMLFDEDVCELSSLCSISAGAPCSKNDNRDKREEGFTDSAARSLTKEDDIACNDREGRASRTEVNYNLSIRPEMPFAQDNDDHVSTFHDTPKKSNQSTFDIPDKIRLDTEKTKSIQNCPSLVLNLESSISVDSFRNLFESCISKNNPHPIELCTKIFPQAFFQLCGIGDDGKDHDSLTVLKSNSSTDGGLVSDSCASNVEGRSHPMVDKNKTVDFLLGDLGENVRVLLTLQCISYQVKFRDQTIGESTENQLLRSVQIQAMLRLVLYNISPESLFHCYEAFLVPHELEKTKIDEEVVDGVKMKKKKRRTKKKTKKSTTLDINCLKQQVTDDVTSTLALVPFILPRNILFSDFLMTTIATNFLESIPSIVQDIFDYFEIPDPTLSNKVGPVSTNIMQKIYESRLDDTELSEESEDTCSLPRDRKESPKKTTNSHSVGLTTRCRTAEAAMFASPRSPVRGIQPSSKASSRKTSQEDEFSIARSSFSIVRRASSTNPLLSNGRGTYVGSHFNTNLTNMSSLFREVKVVRRSIVRRETEKRQSARSGRNDSRMGSSTGSIHLDAQTDSTLLRLPRSSHMAPTKTRHLISKHHMVPVRAPERMKNKSQQRADVTHSPSFDVTGTPVKPERPLTEWVMEANLAARKKR